MVLLRFFHKKFVLHHSVQSLTCSTTALPAKNQHCCRNRAVHHRPIKHFCWVIKGTAIWHSHVCHSIVGADWRQSPCGKSRVWLDATSSIMPEWCGHNSHTLEVESASNISLNSFERVLLAGAPANRKKSLVPHTTTQGWAKIAEGANLKYMQSSLHRRKSQAVHCTAPIKIIHVHGSDLLGKDSQFAQEQFHNSHSHSTFSTFCTLHRNPCKTRNRSYLHKADCAGSATRVH